MHCKDFSFKESKAERYNVISYAFRNWGRCKNTAGWWIFKWFSNITQYVYKYT